MQSALRLYVPRSPLDRHAARLFLALITVFSVGPLAAQSPTDLPSLPFAGSEAPLGHASFRRLLGLLDAAYLIGLPDAAAYPAHLSAVSRVSLAGQAAYADHYRLRSTSTHIDVSQQAAAVALVAPLPAPRLHGHIQLALQHSTMHLNATDIRGATGARLAPSSSTSLASAVMLHRNASRWGVFAQVQRGRRAGHAIVSRYPTEGGFLLRTFFLNLLPEVFGNDFAYTTTQTSLNATLAHQHRIGHRVTIGGGLTVQHHTFRQQVAYTNQHEGPLGGEKNYAVPVRWRALSARLSAALRVSEPLAFRAAMRMSYDQIRGSVALENPARDGNRVLDIVDLGDGTAARDGFSLGLSALWTPTGRHRLAASLIQAWNTADAAGEVSTPVLGYVGNSQIPIVHSFEAEGTLTAPTQHLRFGWHHRPAHAVDVHLQVGVAHTTARPRVDGLAHMEFGIQTNPLHVDDTLRLTVYEAVLSVRVRLTDRWQVTGQASQLVPRVSYDVERPPGDADRRERGGSVGTLTTSYTF